MGYRSQGGSRRGAGQKFQKSQHAKAKTRVHKHKEKAQVMEEQTTTAGGIGEKAITSLNRLGEQKFAVSPFSQYFNNWLVNLKDALIEFESNPSVKVDETFVNEQQHLLAQTEQKLEELKQEEARLNQALRDLAENNHLLVETDADYAAKTRDLGSRQNAEVRRLTLQVQNLEAELEQVKAMKTSFLRFSKKDKAKKEEETKHKLEQAKAELASTLESFRTQQEKLHDSYEKKKQAIIERVQFLEKEVEKLETDSSPEIRREACEALAKTVTSLLERQPKPST